jgi:hypothetical protein
MLAYRFFHIGTDGHIFRAVDAEFTDDAAAIAQARTQEKPNDIEVWQAKRLVARVPAHGVTDLGPPMPGGCPPRSEGATAPRSQRGR